MKFKIGDHVRIVADTDQYQHVIGEHGVISKILEHDNDFVVRFNFTLPEWQQFSTCFSHNERRFAKHEMVLSKESKIKILLDKIDGKLHKS